MKTKTTLLIGGIVVAALVRGFAQSSFTKITTGNIATEGGASTACAWGDYDNDGWPDLFVNNRDGPNFLYRNKRDGTFERRDQMLLEQIAETIAPVAERITSAE